MIDDDLVRAHRARALSPDHPFIRGTAQNPDVYFQGREGGQPLLPRLPDHRPDRDGPLRRHDRPPLPAVRLCRRERRRARAGDDGFRGRGRRGGRRGAGETRRKGRRRQGPSVPPVLRARHFLRALPPTVERIAVLDRTKEPGHRRAALSGCGRLRGRTSRTAPRTTPTRIGGRYGLSSKEFTPAMVKAVLDECGRDRPATTSPSASATT